MKRFFFLPKPNPHGQGLDQLHTTLRLLLDRGVLAVGEDLDAALKREAESKTFGDATRKLLRIFQEKRRLSVTGLLDKLTADALNRLLEEFGAFDDDREGAYVVRGKVQLADGFPAAGFRVVAFDRDLRHEQLLESALTAHDGNYEIRYSPAQVRKAEKGSADLVIKVLGEGDAVLAVSPITFNAPPQARIDLTIPPSAVLPPALFDRIAVSIGPVLDGIRIVELEEDGEHQDLTFLAGETGIDKPALGRFVISHRLAQDGLPAELWFALLGTVFQFKDGRAVAQQTADVLEGVTSLDPGTVRKAIERAFGGRDIAESYRPNAGEWVDTFARFAARRATAPSNRPSFVRDALTAAGVGGHKQETFARLFQEHRGFTPAFADALRQEPAFMPNEVADLQTSFTLADLTRGDFSVVGVIKDVFNVHTPEAIRNVAKTSPSEWVSLVGSQHASGKLAIPFSVRPIANEVKLPETVIYGRMLERQFREAFPTAAFTGGLERAFAEGATEGLRQPEKLAHFFNTHPKFELTNTRVDEFFATPSDPLVAALANDMAFQRELKAVQRVFKVAPTFEAAHTLLADDVHSAQQIYRLGEGEFVQRYAGKPGFTADSARLTWNQAADTHAAAVTIVTSLKAYEPEGLPQVLQNNSAALAAFPNWNNLFNTGDFCECEACRSVLSPAAYFTDLILFLRDRDAKNPSDKVKDVLFRRRPDLGYLELNCENALTPLPYIDVVCEVLEAAIALDENDVQFNGFTSIPAVKPKAAVATEFANKQIDLGVDFTLSQVKPSDPDLWVVHGDAVTYLLKKKSSSTDFFGEILRNTKTSAAELRAYPQYVNAKAYDKLKAARYPMALPFDLFAEEVRAGFAKSSLRRWDLMETLRGPAAPNNATDLEIAAEYFGISVDSAAAIDELRLIVVADATVAGQQAVWGESAANWIDVVSNVKTFLQKTGLEYTELLALLDLDGFVNPGGTITIKHNDPASCDTATKELKGLNQTNLDRIHRFLRLLRKLKNWKAWELDLVIRTIGKQSSGLFVLDDDVLIALSYFSRLRSRLGERVGVEQLCALFAPIPARTRFTKLHEKREDALYHNLFLNRRLTNPIDPAFILTAAGDLPAGATLTTKKAVVLAALGISDADFALFKNLTKASDGTPYLVNDDLTLANLSFLYRHAWLSRLLKLKASEWKIVLALLGEDIATFADQKAAWTLVERVDELKASGLKPDALSWILAADRNATSAAKETDAARFLAALRKELQAIAAEHDPAQHDFLVANPPTEEAQLSALLASLLPRVGRDETATANFIKSLRLSVVLEAPAEGLPAGFTFPAAITGAHIPITYIEPSKLLRFAGMMTGTQRTALLDDVPAAAGNESYTSAIDSLFEQSATAGDRFVVAELPVVLGGVTLPSDQPSLPIRYNTTTEKLSFVGLMTDDERADLITAGNPSAAIDELFRQQWLALKFFEPVFTIHLEVLPATIDFAAQLPPELAAKVSYDSKERLLRFDGIMTDAERSDLEALVPNVLPVDVAYRGAVNALAGQAQTIVAPDPRVWLSDDDLDPTDAQSDTFAKRLANAAKKALHFLGTRDSGDLVALQASAALGLTDAMTRRLLGGFEVIPPGPTKASVLKHLTTDFTATTGAVDYASRKTTFDGWFWALRAAALLKHWKLTFAEWEQVLGITSGAKLLDFATLPLDSASPAASTENFRRTARLVRLRDAIPESGITLLKVLEKLAKGQYANATGFATDAALLNENWRRIDIEDFVVSTGLGYPADFLLAETWQRILRAYSYCDALNAGMDVVRTFAAPTMTEAHAKALAALLRAKLGPETWLTLATEIQDVLRQRKRDALVAFRLTQPKPADLPIDKWENSNDLYGYYLLDVEMSSCQLTSRLVVGSGSIQLFVQRCFMGLERHVEVKPDGDDGDSAWNWWKWMRKYRVWEANRKVFLWPENWIEPELKKDRSPFFRQLESELLQNEINVPNAEAAFANYLERLDGVAQLEIAGFYQEDDADLTILHVFGRTKGAEPHVYYYRRFDYTQWTPWEKVDLDIQGDYLIPVVVNRRLFLLWPIFTEVPSEGANDTMKIPASPGSEEGSFTPDKTTKVLRMQMAVSDYRQGKWMPKRVSKDVVESAQYRGEIVRKHYEFYPIDRSGIDGRFGVKFDGHSVASNADGRSIEAYLFGSFDISGCKGVPELADMRGYFTPAIRTEAAATGNQTSFMRWVELPPWDRTDKDNDFTLENRPVHSAGQMPWLTQILLQTPGIFRVAPPWHLSYFDRLLLDGLVGVGLDNNDGWVVPAGTWLPFFYNDKQRTFFVLPSFKLPIRTTHDRDVSRFYYPELKKLIRDFDSAIKGGIQTSVKDLDLNALPPSELQKIDELLWQQFPEEAPPPLPEGRMQPYTDDELIVAKAFLVRLIMRFIHFFIGLGLTALLPLRQFHFKNFYHPFVCDFARLLNDPVQGIPGMMRRETQLKNSGFRFLTTYQPTAYVVEPFTESFHPNEVVDFSPDGAYSSYNWELFFHAPLLIGNALSREQRFEEARDWYHYIFNPIGVNSPVPGGSPMSRFWITKPFFETTDPQYLQQRIDQILRMLSGTATSDEKTQLEKQVLDWRTNPFEPHRIANYRTVAYQKTVVMKYLDNLIAWGDHLFRQDTMESLNEATQLYVLAADLLGPRPRKVPPHVKPPVQSFNELEADRIDVFANALVDVENLVPAVSGSGTGSVGAPIPTLYFCIPHNEKMLGYWDTIADRLFKLRHCMNIDGVVRQLALFEPPIDPGALVKAVAAGVDIGAAISDLNAPLPLYRFNVLLQKANEVCADVRALGGALLTALEKKDAEAIALLRQSQELRLLEAVKAVREDQLAEAKQNLEGIRRSKVVVETRRNHYRDIQRLNAQEQLHLSKLAKSQQYQEIAQGVKLAASIISILPAIDLGASGFGGSPIAKFKIGGLELGQAASLAADILSFLSLQASNDAAMASSKASFDRRWDDWKLQERLAERELEQMDRQIAAAELRIAVATKELQNQVLQIENSKAMDAAMRAKYTSQELYQWQIGQVSDVYFKSYRLAVDLAKRAERCFRFELGLADSNFIKPGYWDSLRKGLLSGESLQYDLRRLEAAHLERNRREFELTKHVSLALNDPLALVRLRETGRCFFRVPEESFDLDFADQYFRRIKSVSISIPCVAGPYTTISCTLRLLKNSIRINTAEGVNGYPRNTDADGLPIDDERFIENNIPAKAIAASKSQNDSGMFEMNFRDERYLPFEGAGAISDWSLELFNDASAEDFGQSLRQFDYGTISDVILHINYTAREAGGPFKTGVIGHLRDYFSEAAATPGMLLLDLRREFPTQWSRFVDPTNTAAGNVFELTMSPDLFRFRDADRKLQINAVVLLVRGSDDGVYSATIVPPLAAPPPPSNAFSLTKSTQYGGLHFAQKAVTIMLDPDDPPETWLLKMSRPGGGNLQRDPSTNEWEVGDVLLVLGYNWD